MRRGVATADTVSAPTPTPARGVGRTASLIPDRMKSVDPLIAVVGLVSFVVYVLHGFDKALSRDLGVYTTSVGYATKAKVVGGVLGRVGEKFADACDFDSWHTPANASQAGAAGVTLGSGLDAAMIAVSGEGAPPRVALRGLRCCSMRWCRACRESSRCLSTFRK